MYSALMLVTAAATSAFWVVWFRQEHDEAWLPPGYVEHERAFVWSDALLSTVLTVAAVLLLADNDLGERLALVASGMLLFLGTLDLAYFAREGMFRRERGGIVNAAVVIGVLTVGAVLFVRFGVQT